MYSFYYFSAEADKLGTEEYRLAGIKYFYEQLVYLQNSHHPQRFFFRFHCAFYW